MTADGPGSISRWSDDDNGVAASPDRFGAGTLRRARRSLRSIRWLRQCAACGRTSEGCGCLWFLRSKYNETNHSYNRRYGPVAVADLLLKETRDIAAGAGSS